MCKCSWDSKFSSRWWEKLNFLFFFSVFFKTAECEENRVVSSEKALA